MRLERLEKFYFNGETFLAFNDLHLDGEHFYRSAIRVGDTIDQNGWAPMYVLAFKATMFGGDDEDEDDYDCDLDVASVDEVGRIEPKPGWQHYISNGVASF